MQGKISTKHVVLIILGFISVPLFIFLLTNIPNPFSLWGNYTLNERDWLIFFGGYSGSCITLLVMLYALRKVTRANSETLEKALRSNQNMMEQTFEFTKETFGKSMSFYNQSLTKMLESNKNINDNNIKYKELRRQYDLLYEKLVYINTYIRGFEFNIIDHPDVIEILKRQTREINEIVFINRVTFFEHRGRKNTEDILSECIERFTDLVRWQIQYINFTHEIYSGKITDLNIAKRTLQHSQSYLIDENITQEIMEAETITSMKEVIYKHYENWVIRRDYGFIYAQQTVEKFSDNLLKEKSHLMHVGFFDQMAQ